MLVGFKEQTETGSAEEMVAPCLWTERYQTLAWDLTSQVRSGQSKEAELKEKKNIYIQPNSYCRFPHPHLESNNFTVAGLPLVQGVSHGLSVKSFEEMHISLFSLFSNQY